VQTADFERVLATPARCRTAHFALHHLAQKPAPARKAALQRANPLLIQALNTDLSTDPVPASAAPVDDSPAGLWLGYVVPKRHAKRACTRSLLKRQIRTVFEQHAARLAPGLWVVRLRLPFAPAQFVSASSPPLRAAARAELDGLLARAAA
jgi:ribonuclease P protein component